MFAWLGWANRLGGVIAKEDDFEVTSSFMRLLLYGSRSFSRTVHELALDCGHEVAGSIDDFYVGPTILGTLESVATSHPPQEFGLVMAVGYSDLRGRWGAWTKAKSLGYEAPSLIHPRAYVARSAVLQPGTMVMAGAIVDVRAVVGELSVLWPGVCVNHDVVIGSNCFVAPNATICGNASVGRSSFVGAGAAVADHCAIPENSFIKMLTRNFVKS